MIDREFRVGDKVTCNMYGLGEVTSVREKCVIVRFLNGHEEDYSLDGKCYDIGKRTLFILPKIKPTLKQVKERCKQLLDEVKEVEFINGGKNWFLNFYCDCSDGVYRFNKGINNYNFQFAVKYISLKDTDKIVEEMNKFVKGE